MILRCCPIFFAHCSIGRGGGLLAWHSSPDGQGYTQSTPSSRQKMRAHAAPSATPPMPPSPQQRRVLLRAYFLTTATICARAVVGPRMESLQTYLIDLMQRPEVARGEALSSFLELNSASQLIASAL
jgi:hypothetical protein